MRLDQLIKGGVHTCARSTKLEVLNHNEDSVARSGGRSNFIAISKDGNYVTPASESILQSVTNMSLRQIARDLGMGVEERAVEWGSGLLLANYMPYQLGGCPRFLEDHRPELECAYEISR